METNIELLARLDAAFKGIIEVGTLADSILQPLKFDKFIRQVEVATVIVPEARFIKMLSNKVDIDRTGFVARILKSGKTTAQGATTRELAVSEYSNPNFNTNELSTQELLAIASLRDDALRRNIEKGGFEDTLVSLFGEAAGRDLEEYFILSDHTGLTFVDDDVLCQTDGWCRKAANKVYGVNVTGYTARDFDPSADTYPENMFNAMLSALPKQYLGNVMDWRFWVNWAMYDGYRDILRARGTQLGDAAQSTNNPLYFKGFPVKYCPILERARTVGPTDEEKAADVIEGQIAILGNPDNMVWGVFHEVAIEKEREAKKRRTDFVLTLESDAHFEDENACVVALVDKANPSEAS